MTEGKPAGYKIWIDADSCHKKARQTALKCALRTGARAVLVANRPIPHGENPQAEMAVVEQAHDSADEHILENARDNDIVITRDILFAERLVGRGIRAMNDKGMIFSRENIGALVEERNYSLQMAELGLSTGKFASYSKEDAHEFACRLDQLTARLG